MNKSLYLFASIQLAIYHLADVSAYWLAVFYTDVYNILKCVYSPNVEYRCCLLTSEDITYSVFYLAETYHSII
jgi:hypothetical protein